MTDSQALKDAVAAHLPALLHGSDDAARVALFEMQAVCTNDAMFGALCGMLAELNGDALRVMRSLLPAPSSRALPFFPVLDPGMSQAEQVASQLVAAAANGDRRRCSVCWRRRRAGRMRARSRRS